MMRLAMAAHLVNAMTNLMTYIAEVLAVLLIFLLGIIILSL